MSLQSDLTASLTKSAEKAITAKLGAGALQQHPHLAAMYAQRELEFLLKHVRSLFALRQRKGVTWLQVANIHNRIQACDGGTRLADAQEALNARQEELTKTIADLEVDGLTKQQKAKLVQRKSYRENRVAKAEAYVAVCKKKQSEVDSLLAKVIGKGGAK